MTLMKDISMVAAPTEKVQCSYCNNLAMMTMNDITHFCERHTEQMLGDMEVFISSFLSNGEKH